MSVADVEISETNLVGVVVTDGITNLNFVSTDTPNTTLTDAVAITANTNSYEKYVRVHLKTAGSPATTVQKLIVWISAGTNPVTTGCTVYTTAEEADKAAVVYATPLTTNAVATLIMPGVSNTPAKPKPTTANITIGGIRTPAAPPVHGAGCLINTNTYSDYCVIQLRTDATATVGTQGSPITISFQYDEVA